VDEGEDRRYVVLVNEEEQYSLWPATKVVPAGWRLAGKEGSEQECMAFVDEVWTDMRPLSLRRSSSDGVVETHA
jgi:MbtH protein